MLLNPTESVCSLLGKVLMQDLMDTYGAIVLPKNTLVTEHLLSKALQHPIVSIPLARRPSYELEMREAIVQLERIFEYARQFDHIPLGEVKRLIVPVVYSHAYHPNIGKLLHMLQSADNYTVSHSFAVSVLSALIARWMKLSDKSVESLIKAAVLHDVGKMKIPLSILNKPGKLTHEEYEEMKRHTVHGYELIINTPDTTDEEALVALQHHERVDKSGYPHKLHHAQISLFARIVGVADVFHAMSSNRVYQAARPMYQVLQEMHQGMFGQFDAPIMQLFLTRMMESLVGTNVVLTDGRRGQIVLVHTSDPTSPLIRTFDNQFVDLHDVRSLRIMQFVS